MNGGEEFRKLPSSAEEGKADAVAAAGVVLVNKNHSVDQHHPVCAINCGFATSYYWRSHPSSAGEGNLLAI